MEEALEPTALLLSESLRDFTAGGIGGACGVVAGAPLDLVRIRQQTQPGAGASVTVIVRAALSAEGLGSLFRGMSYPLGTAALQNAVVFHTYGAAARFLTEGGVTQGEPRREQRQQQLEQQQEQQQRQLEPPSLGQVFAAGCFAGAVQTGVVVPVDLLKIRLQLQTAVRGTPGYVGPLRLLANVLQREGLRGLYRGTAITTIRDIPSHGVYFAVYEAAREVLEPGSRAAQSGSPLVLWAAGGLAGALSWLSVYPFDVLKTRIQAAAASQSPYAGWVDCARQAYAAEGTAAFFRGLSTTLGRAFLVNGAIFTAFDLSHKLLSRRAAG